MSSLGELTHLVCQRVVATLPDQRVSTLSAEPRELDVESERIATEIAVRELSSLATTDVIAICEALAMWAVEVPHQRALRFAEINQRAQMGPTLRDSALASSRRWS